MAVTGETSTHKGCPSRSQAVHGTLCSSKVQQEGGFLSLQLTFSLPSPPPQLSSALLFDAVYAVVTAVQELNRSQEIGVKPLSCGSAQIWQHGTSLMNYLRMVRGAGGCSSLPAGF